MIELKGGAKIFEWYPLPPAFFLDKVFEIGSKLEYFMVVFTFLVVRWKNFPPKSASVVIKSDIWQINTNDHYHHSTKIPRSNTNDTNAHFIPKNTSPQAIVHKPLILNPKKISCSGFASPRKPLQEVFCGKGTRFCGWRKIYYPRVMMTMAMCRIASHDPPFWGHAYMTRGHIALSHPS